MEELVWMPVILSAELAPNPALKGQTVKIKVNVLDRLGGEQPESWMSGDLYCGEV